MYRQTNIISNKLIYYKTKKHNIITKTNKHTNKQTDKHTHKQTDRQTYTQTDRQTNKQWETDKHTHRQTDRQTNTQTDRQTNNERLTIGATETQFRSSYGIISGYTSNRLEGFIGTFKSNGTLGTWCWSYSKAKVCIYRSWADHELIMN